MKLEQTWPKLPKLHDAKTHLPEEVPRFIVLVRLHDPFDSLIPTATMNANPFPRCLAASKRGITSQIEHATPRIRQSSFRPRARWYSERPEPGRPPQLQKNRVVAPKTRIAIGVIFCGTLIYSMVCTRPSRPTPPPSLLFSQSMAASH